MNFKTSRRSKSVATGSKDGSLFGKKKSIIATYSKNCPVQVAKRYHFLTPDTPDDWIPPSSKEKTSHQGSRSWSKPPRLRGSTLALRNISNIPLQKTLNRTPCGLSQSATRSLGLPPSGASSSKKPYRTRNLKSNNHNKEPQRTYHSDRQPSKKSREATTYSSKSMSTCSLPSINDNSNSASLLPTIKSMSLCTPLLDGGTSEQLQHGMQQAQDDIDLDDESQILQPQNSTFVEEDFHVEFEDIFPQDLSAIIEEPVNREHIEPPGKKVTVTTIYQSKCAMTGCQELATKESVEPDITPEVNSAKKECIPDSEPRQKRKLAYSMDMGKEQACVLLDIGKGEKKRMKVYFQHTKGPWSYNELRSLPTDVLIVHP